MDAPSRKTMTRVLWMVFAMTLPLPYFVVEIERVPLARIVLFAGLTTAAAVTEPDFASRAIAGMLVVQAGFYGGLLYGLARATARLIERRVPPQRRRAYLSLIVMVLLIGSLFPIFHTPLSNRSSRATLFGILQ
jgi:fructose-specific phosphotransferase system IIC component